MRKTKKRMKAAAKFQAAARGRIQRQTQKKHNEAAAKLQAAVRGKADRRKAAKLKAKKRRTTRVKGRTAYKTYVASYSEANTDKIGGFDGVQLLHDFNPQLEESLSQHGGLKVHVSATGLFRKSVDTKDNEGKLSTALSLSKDFNKLPDDELNSFWHTTHIVQVTNRMQIVKAVKELGDALIERVENQELNGSGWVFVRFKNFEVHIARFKPLK